MLKYLLNISDSLKASCLSKIEQNLMETKHRMKKSMTKYDDSKFSFLIPNFGGDGFESWYFSWLFFRLNPVQRFGVSFNVQLNKRSISVSSLIGKFLFVCNIPFIPYWILQNRDMQTKLPF